MSSITPGNPVDYLQTTVASGLAVALTSGAEKTVASRSLPPGTWDVNGVVVYKTNSGTPAPALLIAGISQTTDLLPARGLTSTAEQQSPGAAILDLLAVPVGPTRIVLAATTTIYLVGYGSWGGGGVVGAYGQIEARKVA